MQRSAALCASVALGLSAAALGPQDASIAFEIVAEFDRIASDSLWPGFQPGAVPLAIYDGELTWLFRHPSPPEPFRSYEAAEEDVWVMEGQHEAVRANSHTEIGRVETAALLADPSDGHSPAALGAVLIHESFHVYQADHHPDWHGNEVELFLYPFEAADPLALRRLETEALRRSLAAAASDEQLCWAALAIELRVERFGLIPEGAASYERGTELNEGLANYVELVAAGQSWSSLFPAGGFAADEIRDRAYTSGTSFALNLDRLYSGWRLSLEDETRPLDELLRQAVNERSPASCEFSGAERREAAERAAADVALLERARRESRSRFLSQPGWKIVVVAGDEPLWPQAFDPLNVQRVGEGEVLHTRWLKLGNSLGALEVLDRTALTEAAGDHPLFNGVREISVGGIAGEPAIEEADGTVIVDLDGFQAEFQGASVERLDRTIVVRLDGGGGGGGGGV